MSPKIRTHYTILKWIPRFLLLAVVGFSIYVGIMYGRKPDSKDTVNAGSQKSKVTQQTDNIEYSHFDQGKQLYHVSAEKVTVLKNKQQQLENPEFVFFSDNKKDNITVSGKHCNISKDFGSITVFDDVVVHSENGMTVQTSKIKYNADDQTFSTNATAQFKWKTMRGRGKGFVYQIDNQQLTLPERPEIQYVNKTSEDRTPILLNGDYAMMDRKSGFAFFEGNVTVVQGEDSIRARRIEAIFKPETSDLTQINAIKDVHCEFARKQTNDAAGPAPATGAPAPAAKPAAAGAAPTAPSPARTAGPRQPAAAKQAPSMANVFSADASSSKELDAQYVELFFYEDGSTIHSFHSTGDCNFVLHTFGANNKPVENRFINGQVFDATMDARGNMQSFQASDNVSVKLQPLGNPKRMQEAGKQTVYCGQMQATLQPETGEITEIHFNNMFRHVQDDRTVTSDSAVYSSKAKKTDLIGTPEITDSSMDITANNMELFEETSGIHAFGNVKSSFVRTEGKTPTTFPFSSPSRQPVYISSEDMVWDGEKSEASYTDKAKLWQDKNVITAAKLIINDKDKTLSAYEKVHTIFYNGAMGPAKPATTTTTTAGSTGSTTTSTVAPPTQTASTNDSLFNSRETDKGPITVDAGIMNYAEKDRIIHFEKEVKIVTTSTQISSEKADFFMKQDSSELDRLYSQGKVSITHLQKKATGNEAVFYTSERKLVLGGMPKLTETGRADITGRELTLFLADDRILIDGQEDGRATTTLQMGAQSLVSNQSNTTTSSQQQTTADSKTANGQNAGSKKKTGSKKRKRH